MTTTEYLQTKRKWPKSLTDASPEHLTRWESHQRPSLCALVAQTWRLSDAQGSGTGNYEIRYGDGGSLKIDKAPLTLSGTNATVTYNGREQRNVFTATDGTTIYNNDIPMIILISP